MREKRKRRKAKCHFWDDGLTRLGVEFPSGRFRKTPNVFDSQDKVSLRFQRIALRVVQKLSENDEQGLAIREYLNIVVGRDVYDELPLEDLLVINQNAHTLGPMLRTYFEPTRLDRSSAKNLTMPTLLITGELSPGIYGAMTRELNNCLPTADRLILPGASHGLQMENPEIFGIALMDFFATTKGAGAKNFWT